jgi:hypothetical protein
MAFEQRLKKQHVGCACDWGVQQSFVNSHADIAIKQELLHSRVTAVALSKSE